MDHFDPNMIEDAIIRKRATQFIGGGAPKTYTRLYLYPAGSEVMKSRNVFNLLNSYGYFMPIPVSPSNLEYKRGASHNEAYGIVSGGLLQRNLPKLWHLTIDTYLPRDIYERTFHNWSQDREWSGEYTQQHFVDYINLIMQYKIPLALFDSSSPERIRHNAEYWCIEQFNYKMQPHDDIDYTLELIEWKEPHVKLSEIEMKEVTQSPTGPSVRRGDGTALMVFGQNDSRAYDRGRVYNANVKVAFTMREGSTVIGYKNVSEINTALQRVIGDQFLTDINGYDWWNLKIYYSNATFANNTARIPYQIDYHASAVTKHIVRGAAMAEIQQQLNKTISRGLKAYADPLSTNVIGSTSQGGRFASDLLNTKSTIARTLADSLSDREISTLDHLHVNAWCQLREVRNNVPLYTLKISAKRTGDEAITPSPWRRDTGYVELKISRLRTWFKEMYVVSPTSGTKLGSANTTPSGDIFYDAKQSWLVPKENTIRTSYKKYLATVLINYNDRAGQSSSANANELTPNKENNLKAGETVIASTDDGWKTQEKSSVYIQYGYAVDPERLRASSNPAE